MRIKRLPGLDQLIDDLVEHGSTENLLPLIEVVCTIIEHGGSITRDVLRAELRMAAKKLDEVLSRLENAGIVHIEQAATGQRGPRSQLIRLRRGKGRPRTSRTKEDDDPGMRPRSPVWDMYLKVETHGYAKEGDLVRSLSRQEINGVKYTIRALRKMIDDRVLFGELRRITSTREAGAIMHGVPAEEYRPHMRPHGSPTILVPTPRMPSYARSGRPDAQEVVQELARKKKKLEREKKEKETGS